MEKRENMKIKTVRRIRSIKRFTFLVLHALRIFLPHYKWTSFIKGKQIQCKKSIKQSTNKSCTKSMSKKINQSIKKQSIDPSCNQSTHSISKNSTNQARAQSIYQSTNSVCLPGSAGFKSWKSCAPLSLCRPLWWLRSWPEKPRSRSPPRLW